MESGNSADGLRRYEDLIRDIKNTADEALALALQSGVVSSDSVLPIANGGTGSSTKNFVDLSTNQFNILGTKIFKASCGFQKESDIVDSGEIAGNIRCITCDEQGADIGPQMRFSGRHTDDDLTPFAFATLAGRKENGVSGDKSGYFQMATTDAVGVISEVARINSEGNMGLGAIPSPGSGDRLHMSGGDLFIDNTGDTRSIKLEIGESIGRIQSIVDIDGIDSESLVLSVNSAFSSGGGCVVDAATGGFGSAAIDIRANGDSATDSGGVIRFLASDSDTCPTLRGFFSENGLDVIGSLFVTEDIVAGGINNAVDGPGNADATVGFITGENIKFGSGSPEGAIRARIGAIYGRTPAGGSDDPGENATLWVKVLDDGGATGWVPVRLGDVELSMCVQETCPDFEEATNGVETPECRTWFDTGRGVLWFWDADVLRTVEPEARGAWLSAHVFQQTVPVSGRRHSEQFRRNIDKDYEYITPTRVVQETVNIYLKDLTAAIRVSNNGNDRLTNYYTFDLVTLEKRQGDPSNNKATRQEWPGDREAFETKKDNLRADGHTTHPTLRDDLVRLSSQTPDGPDPVSGVGTASEKRTNRRVLVDSTKSAVWVDGQFKERENDDSKNGFPANNGFRVQMTSGNYAGIARTIRDNNTTTLILRRPWPRLVIDGSTVVKTPDAGDSYEIVDNQHRKIIARISTKGNIFPDGAHVDPDGDRNADPPPLFEEYELDENGNPITRSQVISGGNFKTRDVQDFVRSIQNGLDANDSGGSSDLSTHFLDLGLYVDIFGSEEPGTEESEPTDGVVLAGLWDAVRSPGRISGVISVTYRLALPPFVCQQGTIGE